MTQKTLTVKIIKCDDSSKWYFNSVGQMFNVIDTTCFFTVISELLPPKTIDFSDCEIVIPAHNLPYGTIISFDEFIKHGRDNGANIMNDMRWSWKINGKSVTHENDNCYFIETMNGIERFERGDSLIAFESGLRILTNSNTHSPGGCPM